MAAQQIRTSQRAYPPRAARRFARRSVIAALVSVLLWLQACDDPPEPLAPADGALASARPADPDIDVDAGAATFVIDGAATTVGVTITNPAKGPLKGVLLVAEVVQVGANHEAARTQVVCGDAAVGTVPGNTTCSTDLPVTVGNSTPGFGMLTAGGATLQVTLLQSPKKVLATASVVVTLVASGAGVPTITGIDLASTQFELNGAPVTYTVTMENPGPPLTGVVVQGEIHQAPTFSGAGGSQVMCENEPAGVLPTGTCSFPMLAAASNIHDGGSLNGGLATLYVYVLDGSGTYDTESVPILIVEPSAPFIYSVLPSTYSLPIDGNAVPYSVTLRNPNSSPQSGITLWVFIEQEGNSRRADNENNPCAADLPVGDCTMSRTLDLTDTSGGGTELVLGPAAIVFELREFGTVIHSARVPATLVASQP